LWAVYRDPAVMHFLGGVGADSHEECSTQLSERTAGTPSGICSYQLCS